MPSGRAQQAGARRLPQQQPPGDLAGIEALISQFSEEKAGRIGLQNTPAFLVDRHDPAQPSVEERTVRLMRAARLSSYNDYRQAFTLRPLKSFAALTRDARLRARLGKEMMMGGLLTVMVAYDTFTQALTNPLLARNVFNEATFSPAGMKQITTTKSVQQIVDRNSDPAKEVRVSFKA